MDPHALAGSMHTRVYRCDRDHCVVSYRDYFSHDKKDPANTQFTAVATPATLAPVQFLGALYLQRG